MGQVNAPLPWYVQQEAAKSLFGGPDNCYKPRNTRMGTEGFLKLVNAADDDYWRVWFDALGQKWGTSRCPMNGNFRAQLANPYLVQGKDPFPDWVSLAIFDRLLRDLAVSQKSVKFTKDTILQAMTDKQVSQKIQGLNKWLCSNSDVLMIQEGDASNFLPEVCPNHAFVSSSGKDTAILFDKLKYQRMETETETAKAAMKTKRTAFIEATADKDVVKFWKGEAKFEVVVIQEKTSQKCYTIMSVHSDSDGKYALDCLDLADATSKSVKCDFVLGMDTNVQLKAKPPNIQDQRALIEKAKALCLDVFVPGQKTVYKTRSFVQSQILKAAKADHLQKDFIFRSCKSPSQVEVIYGKTRVVNQISAPDTYLTTPFPRAEFPVDHFMVFVDDVAT